MSPHRIKDEKLKEIFNLISWGRGGLYRFWNYVEDLDTDESEKDLMHEVIDKAMEECFIVEGFIHVLNESWKRPGSGHVPLKGDKNGRKLENRKRI